MRKVGAREGEREKWGAKKWGDDREKWGEKSGARKVDGSGARKVG